MDRDSRSKEKEYKCQVNDRVLMHAIYSIAHEEE